MPWIDLPAQFHPLDKALVGKITYTQAPMQGAVAQPAKIAVYDFGQPEVIPMARFDRGIADVSGFPRSFMGAIIFMNGTQFYAVYGFQEQQGIVSPMMNIQMGMTNAVNSVMGIFNKKNAQQAAKPPQIGQVFGYLNDWMNDYLNQSSGGQTPHV